MGKKATKRKTKKNTDGIFYLDLGKELENNSFSSFDELRKLSYKKVKYYREMFIKELLKKYGVNYNTSMPRRDLQKYLYDNIVGIVKDEDRNYDMVYKNGMLIGYWNNHLDVKFYKGRLVGVLRFKVF